MSFVSICPNLCPVEVILFVDVFRTAYIGHIVFQILVETVTAKGGVFDKHIFTIFIIFMNWCYGRHKRQLYMPLYYIKSEPLPYTPFFSKKEADMNDGIFKLLRSPGFDSKESIRQAYVTCAGIS
jgi:hypothetical protein